MALCRELHRLIIGGAAILVCLCVVPVSSQLQLDAGSRLCLTSSDPQTQVVVSAGGSTVGDHMKLLLRSGHYTDGRSTRTPFMSSVHCVGPFSNFLRGRAFGCVCVCVCVCVSFVQGWSAPGEPLPQDLQALSDEEWFCMFSNDRQPCDRVCAELVFPAPDVKFFCSGACDTDMDRPCHCAGDRRTASTRMIQACKHDWGSKICNCSRSHVVQRAEELGDMLLAEPAYTVRLEVVPAVAAALAHLLTLLPHSKSCWHLPHSNRGGGRLCIGSAALLQPLINTTPTTHQLQPPCCPVHSL